MPNIDTLYDQLLLAELTTRLNRVPSTAEIANADTDNDLTNEILWQLVCQLSSLHLSNVSDIQKIEKKIGPVATLQADTANDGVVPTPAVSTLGQST